MRGLLKSPASLVDWMAHMGEKTWFQPKKFFEFMDRLRDDNDLYESL